MGNRRTAPLWAITALLAAAAGGLVSYRVHAAQLDLTTGLLLIAAASLAVFALAELAALAGPLAKSRMQLRVLVVTLAVLAAGTELFLRAEVHSLRTYFEQNGETNYRSISENAGPTWFHVYPPNFDLTWTTADFVHSRRTNDLGLSERTFARAKAPGEYRIVALGDSFTEGVGVSYDSSWVRVMERALAGKVPDRQVTAINAGISGSDVFFEYALLKEKLLAYSPDLVIVCVNTTDVDDVMLRGGMERFQADGTFRSLHQPPSWEWLYGISYITRLVAHSAFGYDQMFVRESRRPLEQQQAIGKMKALLPMFGQLASAHGFHVVFVFQPTGGELGSGAYQFGFQSLVDDARQHGLDVIDVLARWSAAGYASNGKFKSWYWPTDGHHTPEGYAMLGNTIANGVLDLGLHAPTDEGEAR